jgi:hypothetical protein
MMRRDLLLALALLLLWAMPLAALADGVSLGAAAAPLSPLDPEWPLADELSRRTPPGPAGAPGRGAAGWDPLLASGEGATAHQLRSWQRHDLTEPAPSVWLRPELRAVGRATDPQRQLTPSYADVREGDEVDPALRAQLTLHLRARLLPSVEACFRFRFDSEGRNDPRNRTRDYPQLGASNDIDEAYLRARFGRAALTLGRMPLTWGPSPHGPLLLSATAPAVDVLHVNLRWGGRHHLQAFAGELSTELDSRTSEPVRRFLYGHRADVWILPWLRLGLSETAVVAGTHESLSLRFANPVQFYAQAQTEEDGNDEQQVNVLDAVDAEAFLGPVHVYGSLVVDDLQIDAAGRDRSPDQLAWALGCTASPSPASPWWAGLEMRRVGSWVGLHDGAGTDYRHFQRPLGSPDGPDTERLLAFVSRWLGMSTRARLDVERRRRGVNRVATEESRIGHAGEAFPRGPVERRWSLRATVQQWIAGRVRVQGEAAWHRFRRLNNGPDDLEVWEVRLTVDLRGLALRWRPAVDES